MKKTGIIALLLTPGMYVTGQEDSLKTRPGLLSASLPAASPAGHRIDHYRSNAMENLFHKKPVYPNAPSGITDETGTSPHSKFILPAILISYGLTARKNALLQALDKNMNREMKRHFPGQFPLDDYMQYLPYVAYCSLNAGKWKTGHSLRDRSIVLVTSLAVMAGTVSIMKNGFSVERPDRTTRTSFPSGHTATAFLGAHLLFHEYKDVSPWIGIAGYASATTVACLRVRNRRHWISDVVAGAGIGILSAEVGRLLLPVFLNSPGMNSHKKPVIALTTGIDNYGLGVAYTF